MVLSRISRCGGVPEMGSSQHRLDLRLSSDALFCCETTKKGMVLRSDRILELHVV